MEINLVSDTVTKPTPEMLRYMFQAEVGDDVYKQDPTVNLLQEKGFVVAALALRNDAVSLDVLGSDPQERLALVLGTEGDGLSAAAVRGSDMAVRIPMTGGVDSLNVAAASAVAFWAVR